VTSGSGRQSRASACGGLRRCEHETSAAQRSRRKPAPLLSGGSPLEGADGPRAHFIAAPGPPALSAGEGRRAPRARGARQPPPEEAPPLQTPTRRRRMGGRRWGFHKLVGAPRRGGLQRGPPRRGRGGPSRCLRARGAGGGFQRRRGRCSAHAARVPERIQHGAVGHWAPAAPHRDVRLSVFARIDSPSLRRVSEVTWLETMGRVHVVARWPSSLTGTSRPAEQSAVCRL